MIRCYILCPAVDREAGNKAMESAGYGRPFAVPVGPEGARASHYACDWQMTARERDGVVRLLAAAAPGVEVVQRDYWDPARGKPLLQEVLSARALVAADDGAEPVRATA